MGLYRAFVQPAPTPVPLPNGGQVTNIPLSTTTPAAIIMARSDGRRRGFFIENGNVPMVFALGATVSVGARTARLEPGDVYEDTNNWQGAVHSLSIGSAGNVNVTELLIPA